MKKPIEWGETITWIRKESASNGKMREFVGNSTEEPNVTRELTLEEWEMPAKEVMHKYKAGKLHSGSKKGPKVKDRKQAIAIMLSEKHKEKKGEKP